MLLKIAEAATYLKLHENTLYRLIGEGRVPAIRVGGSVRVDTEEIAKMRAKPRGGKK